VYFSWHGNSPIILISAIYLYPLTQDKQAAAPGKASFYVAITVSAARIYH